MKKIVSLVLVFLPGLLPALTFNYSELKFEKFADSRTTLSYDERERVGFSLYYMSTSDDWYETGIAMTRIKGSSKAVLIGGDIKLFYRNTKFGEWNPTIQRLEFQNDGGLNVQVTPRVEYEVWWGRFKLEDIAVFDGFRYIDSNAFSFQMLLWPHRYLRSELLFSHTWTDKDASINRPSAIYREAKCRTGVEFLSLIRRRVGIEAGLQCLVASEYKSDIWKATAQSRGGAYLKIGILKGRIWVDTSFENIKIHDSDLRTEENTDRRENRFNLGIGWVPVRW